MRRGRGRSADGGGKGLGRGDPGGGEGDGGRSGGCGRCGHAPNRAAPGLLLATGQLLSISDLHRLARTSSLTRMVLDAEGQVLDMGRAVRLATAPQRRAVFARYSTCWVDGCPLPAVLCQIDHADNWSDGGRTDLRLLGPACQFHNRDRYRHPDRYQRRKAGKDRWAYAYTGRRYRRSTPNPMPSQAAGQETNATPNPPDEPRRT
ncbi:HNH endonuclease signature motif containing protein [Planotetraspora phitsanulokensis]|uniref:HNH endonuclease signature motif containing protein n=1 Tax=Planotetraspora phitsanulokensis TaxID=575192 RepID=UPI0031EECF27